MENLNLPHFFDIWIILRAILVHVFDVWRLWIFPHFFDIYIIRFFPHFFIWRKLILNFPHNSDNIYFIIPHFFDIWRNSVWIFPHFFYTERNSILILPHFFDTRIISIWFFHSFLRSKLDEKKCGKFKYSPHFLNLLCFKMMRKCTREYS